MRVTYVVHQFFPHSYTGTERVVLNLAKQMQRMGHQVRVLTYGVADETREYSEEKDGILLREYSYQGVPVLALKHRRPPNGFGMGILPDRRMASVLESLLPRYSADVFHIVHAMTLAPVAHVARDHGIPVVLTFTDFWTICPRVHLLTPRGDRCFGPGDGCTDGVCFPPDAARMLAERRSQAEGLLACSNRMTAPSKFVISMLRSNGYDSRDILLIRHGVDYKVVQPVDKTYAKDSQINFGYIGTILFTKGVQDLAEAWLRVRSDSVQLHVYGEFSDGDAYHARVKHTLSRDARARLLGKYEYDDVAAILTGLDVVVIPSTMFETSSLVLALSLAAGIPVITQNIGAPSELVKDGYNGFLVSPGDTEGLSAIMQRIADNPMLLNELKRNITSPPRIEEEAFQYEQLYWGLA